MNWMFVDMDSFFASVEQSVRPELRRRPVGVVPLESDHTSIIAASYDAKRCGVKVGTKVRDARRLCPDIALVKARPAYYVEVHHRILASVEQCAPIQKVYSIDEWSIRLAGEDRHPAQAMRLAERIKQQLRQDFGPWLTCSAGIATSRLLAKIASGLQKPNGLTVLPVEELPGRLESLPLKSLCGISDGILGRLQRHGIESVRQLWDISRDEANRIWGSIGGGQWWAGLHGLDEPETQTRRRTMSHSHVLDPRVRHPEGAHAILVRLTCKLAQRLRRFGYVGNSLSLSVSDERGRSFGDKVGLPSTADTPTLLAQLDKLWSRRTAEMNRLKKVGVSVSDLVLASQVPRSLFDEVDKLQRVSQAMDQINRRCGHLAVYSGILHTHRQPMENKIAFGRIPDAVD